MQIPEQSKQHFKRIKLPSGKTIEVVYFSYPGGAGSEAPPAPTFTDTDRELHVCGQCESVLVYPTHWEEAGRERWKVTVRCPNCEWTETEVFAQEVVDRFDEELDRGTAALTDDLKRLVRANMAEEVDRFTSALRADAIQPMDF